MNPFHAQDGFRAENGDRFLERLLWHTASGVVAALLVWGIQTYTSTSQAVAANLTSRVTSLEVTSATRTEELVNIEKELDRLNANIERLRK